MTVKITEKWIRDLVESGAEESLHLEFKSAAILDFSSKHESKHKDDLAKHVSAFANSDGGIIICGIKEINQKAGELEFIDATKVKKEAIEGIINSRVNKRIPGLEILPIRFNGMLETAVYVLRVPQSSNSPHQSGDKKFYRRYNYECVPMEEYEIRDAYFRSAKPQLDLEIIVTNRLQPLQSSIRFNVKNTGSVPEEGFKIELLIPIGLAISYRMYVQNPSKCFQVPGTDNYIAWKGVSESKLYPGESDQSIFAQFSKAHGVGYNVLYESREFYARLYYTSGITEYRFKLIPPNHYKKLLSKEKEEINHYPHLMR